MQSFFIIWRFPFPDEEGSACYAGVSHSLDDDSGPVEGKVWGEMKQAR
jgi:hypothetical protein